MLLWFPFVFLHLECSCCLVVLCNELWHWNHHIESSWNYFFRKWKRAWESNYFCRLQYRKISFFLWQLITRCTLAIGYSLQSSPRLLSMWVHVWIWQVKLPSLNLKAHHHFSLNTFGIFYSVNGRFFFSFWEGWYQYCRAMILLSRSYFIPVVREKGEKGMLLLFSLSASLLAF